MVSGIQGMGSAAQMQQMRAGMMQMQQFQSGEVNLSKEDLVEMQEQMATTGAPEGASDDLSAILEAYDDIDTNADGISVDEMNAFTQSTGISFGPGEPPPGLMAGKGGPGGPGGPGGKGGPPPAESSTEEDEESYIDKLLESYSSYESGLNTYQTLSYSA